MGDRVVFITEKTDHTRGMSGGDEIMINME